MTVTIKDGSTIVAEKVVSFDKNTTQIYEVGEYLVEVSYNGNGVKSAKIVGGGNPTNPTDPDPDPESSVELGHVDYDYQLIRDTLFIPNNVKQQQEFQYDITGYVNDINTQYTQVLMEYGKDGWGISAYDYGMGRETIYQNHQAFSYNYDGRGSVSELVNGVGSTQLAYLYSGLGEVWTTTIGWNNPLQNSYRYNAERSDDLLGYGNFQYLRARYLDLGSGVFATQDSYLGRIMQPLSLNRYLYVRYGEGSERASEICIRWNSNNQQCF